MEIEFGIIGGMDELVPDLQALGSAIRRRRERMGLSQRALAIKAGVSQPHLRSIEAGSGSPGLIVVAQVARALSLTMDELLAEAGWLPGPDLTSLVADIADELTPAERHMLVNVGRLLLEAREGGIDLRMEPVAAYDRPDPEHED